MPIRKLPEIIDRIVYIDDLIRKRTPKTVILKKLNISTATWYNYLEILKQVGFPISYDRCNQKYTYTEEGDFHFGFRKTNDSKKIG